MNHLCFVCYAEISPEAEACFSCGSVRGLRIRKVLEPIAAQGITIAGETREDAAIRPEALPPGITFSHRFTIQDELSHTPLWFRYNAVDLERGQNVELRTLREGDRDSQGWQAMTYMQRYQGHPNLLGFLHVDLVSSPPFAVSEIQRGIQLSKFLKGRNGRVTLAESVVLIQELLIGLSALHEEGYAHADIHPDSIWLDSKGRPRLDGGGPFGRSEVSIYAPPEQLSGDSLTPQSDMYTIGLLWYRILTGELPFNSLDASDIQSYPAQQRKDLAPLSPRLAVVVRKMLDSDPSKRPADARTLLRRLRDIFRHGWFNIPELSRSELSRRACSNRFVLHGSLIATNDALRLLKSGAAIGTASLESGRVLLRTSTAALTEAGLQELLPTALKSEHSVVRLMLDCMVHDLPNTFDLLKEQPARNISEQLEIAQLARAIGYTELARLRIGAAIQAAKSCNDWCGISETLNHLGDNSAAKEALQKALEMASTVDDILLLASLVRWQHNDHGITKRALKRAVSWMDNTEKALRVAAAWLALLNDSTSAQAVLDQAIELSSKDNFVQQCDTLQEAISIFGLTDIWLSWLEKIQPHASDVKEKERIAWLWQHLKRTDKAKSIHQEIRQSLLTRRQMNKDENERLGIHLESPELTLSAIEAFELKSLQYRQGALEKMSLSPKDERNNFVPENGPDRSIGEPKEIPSDVFGSPNADSNAEESVQELDVSSTPQTIPLILWVRLVVGCLIVALVFWLLLQ